MQKLLVLMLMLCSANVALADEEALLAVNNQVRVQVINTDLDYDEYSGKYGTKPGLLSSESGANKGVSLSLSMLRDVFFGDDYFSLQYSRIHGHTDYVGSTFEASAGYGSLRDTSGAKLTDFSVSYGRSIQINPDFLLIPYIQLAHHEWKRLVNSGQTYRHEVVGLGVMPQYSPNDKLVLSANVMIGRTVDSRVKADAVESLFPSFKTALGNATIYKLGINADYAFTRHVHANIGFDFARFKYGDSAIVYFSNNPAVTAVYEPKSDSAYRTLSVGFGYAW
jgi:hypothetical protein